MTRLLSAPVALAAAGVAAAVFFAAPGSRSTALAQPTAPTAAQVAAAADVRASLEWMRSQYQSLQGAKQAWSLVAQTPAEQLGATPNVVDGQITIAVSGSKYRYNVSVNGPTEILTSFEVAYDGVKHQVFDKEARVLTVRNGDTSVNHIGVPIPFMLPWEFLSRDDDACPLCKPRLADLADPAVWDARIGQMTLLNHDPGTQTTVVRFPGGVLEGKAFDFHVWFKGPAGEQVPERIQRVLPDGRALTEVTLSGYQWFAGAGGSVYFPTSMAVDAVECQAAVVYHLTAFELAGEQALGSNAFTIDQASARRVWDSDAQRFVR